MMTSESISTKKVLVVDDDASIRRALVTQLKSQGIEVYEAADGEQGLAMIETEHPALVLLDIMMPKVNGFKVLESMNSLGLIPTVRVVIFSSLGQAEDIERGRQLGAVDYMVKTDCEPEEVVRRVTLLLS